MAPQKHVHAAWQNSPQPGNFGDILTPILLDKMFDRKAIRMTGPFASPTIMGIGSTIGRCCGNTVVWGSGIMRWSDPLKADATYLCVRGPQTHAKLAERKIPCPEIFGDPALLMPKIHNPTIEKKYKYGIFAHYVDTKQVTQWYGNDRDIKIIDPLRKNPLDVIDDMLQCEKIISSSLHGIIISHAYDVPAIWVKHSDKLNGDGMKFRDYFESVGLEYECTQFEQKRDPADFGSLNFQVGIDIDMDPVENALREYLG